VTLEIDADRGKPGMVDINGGTRLFGLFGDPIAHTRAYDGFNLEFQSLGVNAILVPVHARKESLAAIVEGWRGTENCGGFIVTLPHKVAIAGLVDQLGDTAELAGAVNAVRCEASGRLIGELFDGAGFLAALAADDIEIGGRRCFMIGAGGAGRALAFAIAGAGARALTIANRTTAKARVLAEQVGAAFPSCDTRAGPPDPAGHDVVVNATSLGLDDEDGAPFDVGLLTPAMAVIDIINRPRTRLIAAARKRGCRTQTGEPMLVHQIGAIAEFLTGAD
jgi:shikimate dehydrogenase